MEKDGAQIVQTLLEAIDRRHDEVLKLMDGTEERLTAVMKDQKADIDQLFVRHNQEHKVMWRILLGMGVGIGILFIVSPGREFILPLLAKLI